jgi:tetratricopeptide (TPR) repeat protein
MLAIVAGLAVAIWTLVAYRPPASEIEARQDREGQQELSRAIAERVGGFENMDARIRDLLSTGSDDEALRLAREWSRGVQDDPVAGYWSIALLMEVGDLERARRVAGRRFELVLNDTLKKTNDHEAWYIRGWYERALGFHDEATHSFEYAADLLRASRPRSMPEAVRWYNIACYETLAGRTEHGLASLETAVGAGWNDVAWLCADPDLSSLREEPRFVEIALRLSTRPG